MTRKELFLLEGPARFNHHYTLWTSRVKWYLKRRQLSTPFPHFFHLQLQLTRHLTILWLSHLRIISGCRGASVPRITRIRVLVAIASCHNAERQGRERTRGDVTSHSRGISSTDHKNTRTCCHCNKLHKKPVKSLYRLQPKFGLWNYKL